MTTKTSNHSRNAWLIFGVFLVLTVGLLIFNATWFWVPLPVVLTAFVVAIDYI